MTIHKILPILIAIFLFIIPFFWFAPGEMDLGGDSSRLYFYDPLAYLINHTLYGISSSGFGGENISYYAFPFIILLFVLKLVLQSPTLLIAAFHGMSLSVAFVSCYFIVKELIQGDSHSEKNNTLLTYAAVIAGLFYVFSPSIIQGWDKVILTHNQVFLNPLMFLLLLRFFLKNNINYLLLALMVSFFFSPNFGFTASPPFFAFYPLSFMFLFLYARYIRKRKIPLKALLVGVILFSMLQAFHLLPQFMNLLSPDSGTYNAVFSEKAKISRGLGYFIAIAPQIKVSINLMGLPQMMDTSALLYIFIILPIIIVLGFLWNKKKTLLLTGIFFLITLFFASANITNIGFTFYKQLFDVPGFSMFRNFYGQWMYAFLFFYTLLLGQAIIIVLNRFRIIYAHIFIFLSITLLIFSAWPFIDGRLVNKILWQSNEMKSIVSMDPQYKNVLTSISNLPVEGRVLTLPLSDPGYQTVAGVNRGIYQGPSTIAYLAGKQDFAGFEELGRFKEFIMDLAKNKQYTTLKTVLGMLNIKYIFYNADPLIYDTFPGFPYEHVRKFLPKDQASYKEFLNALSLKEIKKIDANYYIYELPFEEYFPRFSVANNANYFSRPITNWSIPFSFKSIVLKQNTNLKPIFFEDTYIPPFPHNIFVQAEPSSIYLKVVKNPDPPLVLHHAFATIPPQSIFYTITEVKEKITLGRHAQIEYHYHIDKKLFFSAKRIFELERWGAKIPVNHTVNSIEDLHKYSNKNELFQSRSWETLLARYVQYFEENITTVEQASESEKWKTEQKFLMNEYLLDHRRRLSAIIHDIEKSEDQKEYLNNKVDMIFSYISKKLQFSLSELHPIEYSFSIPQGKKGTYDVFMKKDTINQFNISDVSLQIQNQDLKISNIQPEDEWIKFGSVVLNEDGKEQIFNLTFRNPKNLIENAEPLSLEKVTKSTDTATLRVDVSQFEGKNGLIWQVDDWQAESYYLLSFDYFTDDAPFLIKVFEEESKTAEDVVASSLVQNQLKAGKWMKYQAVIRSNKYADRAFIQIVGDRMKTSLAEVKLKNIALVQLPHPTIVLKKVPYVENTQQLPEISFTKVNPTKYKVYVRNATKPYLLVFNQAFNKRWKIFLTDEPRTSKNILVEYANKNVRELKKQTTAFDTNPFETWKSKPIADATHIEVNGYANGWYIDPKDVAGKREYELTVEMQTQKTFYIGLFISSLGFFAIVFFLLKSLIKWKLN